MLANESTKIITPKKKKILVKCRVKKKVNHLALKKNDVIFITFSEK